MPPALAHTMRDPRLDFFRGLGMFIILVAHIPYNGWALWIPARFGFSDAAEIFVFLSGMASAIAFGRTFDKRGFLLGTARVAQRIWQIYWAHLAMFVAIAAMMVLAGTRPDGSEPYVAVLNLRPFFRDPGPLLVHLMTLTYVPNYFDILPMYMVLLALMPVMLLAERLHRIAPFLLMALLWAIAQTGALDLPAEPWSERPWFFNPFGWQLIFFTGFFFMRGKLPAPPLNFPLLAFAVAVVVITIPFAWGEAKVAVPALAQAGETIEPLIAKTPFGLLRYVHFLSLAYLAYMAVGEGGRHLKGAAVGVISHVGRQSLAVFIAGMVVAQALGIFLDYAGRGFLAGAAANLAGFAILIAVAYTVGWFKATPWKGAAKSA